MFVEEDEGRCLALHHQKDVLHETISLTYTVKLRIPFVSYRLKTVNFFL